jgi:cytochrome oxidase Cu insertion factor (SCO1/SenC/PrrC family)
MRIGLLLAALGAAAALAAAGAALAQDKGKEKAMDGALVAVGAEAPDFRLNDQDGGAVRLSGFRGKKWVVLAFFPKAMTGG